jgi:hypothetical protein
MGVSPIEDGLDLKRWALHLEPAVLVGAAVGKLRADALT